MIFNIAERYRILQKFGASSLGNILEREKQGDKETITLSDVGLRPDDITLSFLYWNFTEEIGQERIRGQKCRILKLVNPENKGEFLHMWVSVKYIFPLKVQWFKSNSEEQLVRTLEFTGFQKIKEIWVVKELRIKGRDWKTIVKLKDNVVEFITPTDPFPENFFVTD